MVWVTGALRLASGRRVPARLFHVEHSPSPEQNPQILCFRGSAPTTFCVLTGLHKIG